MIKIHPRARLGFTLIELAIVLAVAGLLFSGLWRLLASGNQQLRDTSAASQQAQLISSVKGFLASPLGQQFLGSQCTTATGCAAGLTTFSIPLPPAASPAGSAGCPTAVLAGTAPITAMQTGAGNAQEVWCSTLPSGFSSASVNSYGQTYAIRVRFDSATAAATQAPATYSIMIVTQGGDLISDGSGGRISTQIGNDGGFVYNTTPCGAAACGAYGSWAINPASAGTAGGYGFPAANVAAGHVASRTFVSPEQDANLPWLARILIPGGGTGYNTMQTNFYLNASGGDMESATPGNIIYGTGVGGATFGGAIQNVNQIIAGMNPGNTTSALTLNDLNGCSADVFTPGPNPGDPGVLTDDTSGAPTTCYAALQINGNQVTTGMVEARVLWASSFIYGTTSDARLKKDIEPLSGALDNIMKLKPVTFRYKKDIHGKENIGFIAQDLQKIYPQVVAGRPDGALGVDYMQMIAPLAGAIQDLKKENDRLRDELRAQDAAIKALQEKNAD